MPITAWLTALWRNLAGRSRREHDIDEEIRATFELIVSEKLQNGLTLEAARRAAAIELGGVEQVKEQVRYTKAGFLLESVLRDFGYAARSLRKHSGFAVAAVSTLALGTGATTAIFSVVYGVLLKPLPFDEPDTLVTLAHRAPGANRASMNQNTGTYFTYLDQNQVFSGIGAWDTRDVSITGHGDPEQVEALVVSNTTLATLRVQPQLGRLFGAKMTCPAVRSGLSLATATGSAGLAAPRMSSAGRLRSTGESPKSSASCPLRSGFCVPVPPLSCRSNSIAAP